jgi:hypothetical protein
MVTNKIKGAGMVLLLWAATLSELHAQPVPDRILDTVEVKTSGQEIVIQVNLAIPVRNISHFPCEAGKELRVRLQPVAINPGDRDALFARESLVPAERVQSFLEQVIYEGDIVGGPYLTFIFSRSVHFVVEQGRDSRSIVVRITVPAEPSLPPGKDTVR